MKTVTQWFTGKPVHVGAYQNGDKYTYQYWNGKFWGCAYGTAEEAACNQGYKSMFQDDPWRGLASKP